MKATRKFKDYAMKHAKLRKTKKVKGFTLVELIIVIAIIGILAAILIPTMTGKVKSARLNSANDSAAKIAEQAAVIISEMEAEGAFSLTADTVIDSATNYNPSTQKPQADLVAKIKKAVPASKNGEWGIKIETSGAILASYFKGSGYIGTYPKPANKASSETSQGTIFGWAESGWPS